MNEETAKTEWEVGQLVVVDGSRFCPTRAAKIDRISKTMIFVGNDRFNKTTGLKVGSDAWNSSWIKTATPERLEEIRRASHRRKLLGKIQGVIWKHSSTEVLERVCEILENNSLCSTKTS